MESDLTETSSERAPAKERARAPHVHHDTLEILDGEVVLLTDSNEGQEATVLPLRAQPSTEDASPPCAQVSGRDFGVADNLAAGCRVALPTMRAC